MNRIKKFLMTTLHIVNGQDLFAAVMLVVIFAVAALVLLNVIDPSALMNTLF